MSKLGKINLISLIIIVGFLFAIMFHTVMGAFGFDYPYNTFLFLPSDRYMDFFGPLSLLKECGTPYNSETYMGVYFPFSYLIFNFFLLFNPVTAFMLFSTAFILYFMFYTYANIKIALPDIKVRKMLFYLVVFSVCTYPFIFAIDRANIDMVLFIFLSVFMYLYLHKKYTLSSIILAFAIAMKLYPLPFLTLFFADNKYKQAVATILLVLILTLASFYYFSTDILYSYKHLLMNLKQFFYNYAIANSGWYYGSSLWGLIKIFADKSYIYLLHKLYGVFALSCVGCSCLYVWFVEKEIWKKACILTISILLFPSVTSDYRLLVMFLPMWLFIIAEKETRYDKLFCICFGLLMIPKSYIVLPNNVSLGMILNPLIMILMLLVLSSGQAINVKSIFQKKCS